MRNDGLQETFYIPLRYLKEWDRFLYSSGMEKFHIRTQGVPLGIAKNNSHFDVEAEIICKELGLKPRKNLLAAHYKGEK